MTATLRSNRGLEELAFEFHSIVPYAHEHGFESTIRWMGTHWDGDHTFPQSVSIGGLWLALSGLTAWCVHITQWTALPLEMLVPERLKGTFALGSLPGQVANLSFGSSTDTISGLNPVLSMSLSAGVLQCSFHFITDQSCLSSFAKEVQRVLSEHANPPLDGSTSRTLGLSPNACGPCIPRQYQRFPVSSVFFPLPHAAPFVPRSRPHS
jgi:hypothetical protein